MEEFRVRVRPRVRLKNGTILELLPNAVERNSRVVEAKFHQSSTQFMDEFSGELAGFVLVAWNYRREHMAFVTAHSRSPLISNDLPNWVGEAVRREIMDLDARDLIDGYMELQDKDE